MSLVARIGLPALIERGRDTAISLSIHNAAGAEQTATAATLTLYDGGETILDGVTATSLGPPASHTVTAATTTDRALSSEYLAVWTMTIGGSSYVFRQPAYLVRHILYPTVTDDDLTELHSDLDALRDTANMTTFQPFRERAWEQIQRRLIARGNRPALVLDSWALKDLHTFGALRLAFRDFASSLGDERYAELAAYYDTAYQSEWDAMVLRYDDDENGTISSDERRTGSPVLYLNRPRYEPSKWRR